jgi:hypothetical protein
MHGDFVTTLYLLSRVRVTIDGLWIDNWSVEHFYSS